MTDSQNGTIRNATNYSPSCLQIIDEGLTSGPIDEDCLYLNVWAPTKPSTSSAGYPVMLWIHGGAFIEGSATQVIYDGLSWTNAAINENNSFIMVSINYRLNVMGFFSQLALLDESGQTIANQGITDQRMAMTWIRDNIAQFGGDKNSVTLMGQSAGSHSVCIHIASPLSASLFHAGILDSGTCDTFIYLRDKSFAYSTTQNLASLVGCNMNNTVEQLACLRAINGTLLVNSIGNVSIPISVSLAFKDQEKVSQTIPFCLIVDEVEIPIHPLQAFLLGTVNQVPILIGANHDEFVLRTLYEDYSHPPISAVDYLNRILPIMTYNHSEIQALYTPSQFSGNYSQAFVALLSQVMFICGSRRMAGYMSRQPTYFYTYNHAPEYFWLTTPNLIMWSGAYHSVELFSLFQTLTTSLYGNIIFKSDELPLATTVRRYWTNMITKRQPNGNVNLIWPQYSSNIDQILVLDENMTITSSSGVYPNCDIVSAVQVSVFGEYVGLNVTCTVENKCFIVNSTATSNSSQTFNLTTTINSVTTASTPSNSNKLRCLQFSLFLNFLFSFHFNLITSLQK
ncbi:unnamed protein product [Rotaria magnacalcarata]|uniref:Carboxylic ester hydrolase n=5 Tax=Rotaria magnacalcarata TaxID=392030 RepID=A0A814FE06_9BILA|nr:unnamed protein product [Rotaria magnacalcarata]